MQELFQSISFGLDEGRYKKKKKMNQHMNRWSVLKRNNMHLENRKWIFISYQLKNKVIDQVNQKNFKFHSQRKFYIIKIKENNKNLLCHIIHTKRA